MPAAPVLQRVAATSSFPEGKRCRCRSNRRLGSVPLCMVASHKDGLDAPECRQSPERRVRNAPGIGSRRQTSRSGALGLGEQVKWLSAHAILRTGFMDICGVARQCVDGDATRAVDWVEHDLRDCAQAMTIARELMKECGNRARSCGKRITAVYITVACAVMFNQLPTLPPEVYGGLRVRSCDDAVGRAHYDLSMNVAIDRDRCVVLLDYSSALFDADTAQRLLSHFIELIEQVT